MKKFHICIRLIAAVLCVALLVGITPADANADTTEIQEQIISTETAKPHVEVVAYREENVKHFDMGDGSYQAVVYPQPVHKKDSEGNWHDIDFSLQRTTRGTTGSYTSKATGAAFAATYVENQPLMTLGDNSAAISLTAKVSSLESGSGKALPFAKAARVTTATTNLETFEQAQAADFSSSILYEDVLPNADIRFVTDGAVVTQQIIVAQKASTYRYGFDLELTGLYAELKESGCVAVYDQNAKEEKYVLPTPIMYDALGNVSEDITYTMTNTGNTYTLTMEADAAWINDTDRSMPVTLSASYSDATSNVTQDTFIKQTEPSADMGDRMSLWIKGDRVDTACNEYMVTYIYAPTISIPEGMLVDRVYLNAHYYYYDYVTTGHVNVNAHRVTFGAWSESLNYNLMQQYTNWGCDPTILDTQTADAGVGATYDSPQPISFDITNAAIKWLRGDSPNYGISLQYNEDSQNWSMPFKSTESSATYGPRFTYTYGDKIRFINYYDSTLTDNQIATINDAISFASAALYRQFGIRATVSGYPQYKGTLTDACGKDVNSPCSSSYAPDPSTICPVDCRTHHKNIYNISNQLLQENPSACERIVFWTDHEQGTYCENTVGGMHFLIDPLGQGVIMAKVVEDRPVIHMLNLVPDNGSDTNYTISMSLLLLHELAHTFGMEEVYEKRSDHNSSNTNCVMASYSVESAEVLYGKIENGSDAFCNNCENDLRPLIFP